MSGPTESTPLACVVRGKTASLRLNGGNYAPYRNFRLGLQSRVLMLRVSIIHLQRMLLPICKMFLILGPPKTPDSIGAEHALDRVPGAGKPRWMATTTAGLQRGRQGVMRVAIGGVLALASWQAAGNLGGALWHQLSAALARLCAI